VRNLSLSGVLIAVVLTLQAVQASNAGVEIDLRAGPVDGRYWGAAEGHRAGRSTLLGDLNGDGIQDLVIGGGSGVIPAGSLHRTWVLLGPLLLPVDRDLAASPADIEILGV